MLYEIHDLNFSYPGGPPVLEQVCLTLKEGEILTVLGPNGAGKSTLLNCMMGLLPTQAGAVRLCGRHFYVLRRICCRRGGAHESVL